MHRNRPSSQRYVSFVPNVGNPDFSMEERYATLASPDAGYRLLALFRFWKIITYWFPYRDVMDEDWYAVLAEFVPVMMRPLTGDAYRLALIRLIGRIHDTHANIWSDPRVQPPTGSAEAPLSLRFVENRLLVTGYTHSTLGPATGLRIGDEIQTIEGVPVPTLVDSLRPYYPASNEPTRLRDMARSLTRGAGPVALAGVGAAGAFSISVTRQPLSTLDRSRAFVRDLEGPTFRMLADSVAYLKLSSVVAANAASYIEQAQRARVLVIDIRNDPDGQPTQRIGIVPDLVVRPTVAGIRAGRDEVLEAGVSRALGRAFRLP